MLLTLPWRANFKQIARWSKRNEGPIHNWFSSDLELIDFQRSLIDKNGSGVYCTLLYPSYLPKSGKCTLGLGRYWEGQAGAVKRGLELEAFAVGDVRQHKAFHLSASMTPSSAELKAQGKTLMNYYVSLVARGKGDKVNWSKVDGQALPLVMQDQDKRVRSGRVWVKCLRRVVKLVAVEYLRPDGSTQCHKLYFCTDADKNWEWILQRYGLRFQIEFLFRDAKQFTGLAHGQSSNKTKIENHVNLALGAVSVAKVAHWLP